MKRNPIDPFTRDSRLSRAESVLTKYNISTNNSKIGSSAVFTISGGTKPYVVTIDLQWKTSPRCTCPDASQRAKAGNAGLCKHIIAVLLKNPELSYQLLDLFI
jgi:uncharacterized Zn finger protein